MNQIASDKHDQRKTTSLSVELAEKRPTPSHISGTIESPISDQAIRMMSNPVISKDRLPILKAYTGPPKGIDGKVFRGNVEMGHTNDTLISQE